MPFSTEKCKSRTFGAYLLQILYNTIPEDDIGRRDPDTVDADLLPIPRSGDTQRAATSRGEAIAIAHVGSVGKLVVDEPI